MAEGSQRTIAQVTELAVIAADVDYETSVPGGVEFGAERNGTLQMLLKFEAVWRDEGQIGQAFLLLEPLPRGRASSQSVAVDVFRVEEPWSKTSISWLEQPALGHPKARGIAVSNGSPLRIDITRLVQYLRDHPRHDHGIAVRASAQPGAGVAYATGVAGGAAPRIEVYTR